MFIMHSNLLAPTDIPSLPPLTSPHSTTTKRYFLLPHAVAEFEGMSSSHSADASLNSAHQDPNVVDNGLDIRMPSGSEDPLTDAEIQRYREEINRLDRVILDAVKRRTEVSRTIGKTRMSSGGTRLVHTREIAILNEFRDELGEEGPTIASALLRLGRGKLG